MKFEIVYFSPTGGVGHQFFEELEDAEIHKEYLLWIGYTTCGVQEVY